MLSLSTRSRRSTWNPTESLNSPSNRRKQNLTALDDDVDDITILSKYGKPGKPDDLAMVPVYLSGAQKELFFSPLRQVDPNEPDGKHVCSQCNEEVPNLKDQLLCFNKTATAKQDLTGSLAQVFLDCPRNSSKVGTPITRKKEGRRHMVTHIRVMRLRCSLCGAGSFFCTDLRVHLMEGYCEKLYRAPEGIVNPNAIPCMTKEQADALSELVDPVNPGRVMYTSGQIVSAKSRKPYYPDPVIEERILGTGRIGDQQATVRSASKSQN
ncbi:unnamed protein product [Nippostrongylus brasiliensis]|uniref:C2H2-type domain-containing protein n=1 Tax=Nippostrongylus brasiliensis TaxID=27835 RepID=A0A0N4XVG3_NIPBR|nr:unnamed protein product [Nippostrongylus brasiliensis]